MEQNLSDSEDMLELYVFENRKLIDDLTGLCVERKGEKEFNDAELKAMFRTMHTMKGSASLMMYDETERLTHKMEDVMFFIRENRPKDIDRGKTIDYMLKVCDYISRDIDRIEQGKREVEDPTELIESLDGFLREISENNGADSTAENKKKTTQIYVAPVKKKAGYPHYFRIIITYKPGTQMPNMRAYRTVRALGKFGETVYSPENIIYDNSTSDEIMKDGFSILIGSGVNEMHIRSVIDTDDDVLKADIFAISAAEFSRGFNRGAAKSRKELAPGDFVVNSVPDMSSGVMSPGIRGSLIPVDARKLNALYMGIEELERIVNTAPREEAIKILAEIKAEVLSMKKVPLTKTFHRMNRLIFDASRKLGKSIDCVMEGEDTELDPEIIEKIADPLMHIVRNSVDHGVESEEERRAAGKNARGRITLKAEERGGEVLISVTDDGCGLNRHNILEKAKERGIIPQGTKEDELSEKEVYDLILSPGFSTSDSVNEFSGRGVGMDVVVSSLADMGGKLEIKSICGSGTTMLMHIKV